MEMQKWKEQMARYQTYRTLSPLPMQEKKQIEEKHILPANYKELLFGKDELKEWQKRITRIELLNHLPRDTEGGEGEAVLHKDLSMHGDGSFIGWVEKAGEEAYILHLDADGAISAPENSTGLFADFSKVKSIAWNCEFDTGNVTNMGRMFERCSSLVSLDVSRFDTKNVTTMWKMFNRCSKLKALDVSNFDTKNVTSMWNMFCGCRKLEALDVSGFDTGKVKNMSYMFCKCSSLKSLDVSRFDTKNVTNMSFMFSECSSLKELDVSGFDTENVTDMSCMFRDCSSLECLDVSKFDTEKVTDMSRMFRDCSSLECLDVSGFDTGNVESMREMFFKCSQLKQLNVSNFTMKWADKSAMFLDVNPKCIIKQSILGRIKNFLNS